ncbi:MAG: aminotransferase class V-fold PLP-dependent enzyme [Pseudomonadota bacterium]
MDDRSPTDVSPDTFQRLGQKVVERIAEHLAGLRDLPVAPDTSPAALRARLGDGAMPEAGGEIDDALSDIADLLFANTCLNGHPRMWGYITGSPSPIGALGDLLAAAANPNVAGWNGAPLATEMENQTVKWIGELLGFSISCSGILTSGGNAANFVAMLAARRAKADWDIRQEGMAGRVMTIYATSEAHAWLDKAADLFGMGTNAVRRVKTDDGLRMDLGHLAQLVHDDQAAGAMPFLVVGSAGTTATGAVDPLPEIAALCRSENLWFHVDGCYGAPAVLDTAAPEALAGMAEADSLAVDAHKWLYVPLEAGCTLVRDSRVLTEAFATNPSYYAMAVEEGGEPITDYYAMGLQNSRGLRALKVWLTLKQMGRDGYRRAIARNMAQARMMFEALDAADDFEAATCQLSITTFRYVPRNLVGRVLEPAVSAYLNNLNAALMMRVQRSGDLYLSTAVVDDRQLLRACIVNFRTTDDDVRSVPERVRCLAEPLDAEMRGEAGL